MKNKILISCIFVLMLIIISFTFIVVNAKTEDEKIAYKAQEEIEYLEDRIIIIMNDINNISLSNVVLTKEKIKSSEQNQENKSNEQSSNSNSGGNNSSSDESRGNSLNSSNNSESGQSSSKNKATKYEIKTSSILSNTNQQIDWENIKVNIETIYTMQPNLIIDLHSLNVNSEDILKFTNVLDQVTLSAKQEDKVLTINNLASLYAFLPNYKSQFLNDDIDINIDYTKTCILNSYALLEQDKWDEMKTQISNGINYFSNVMNTIEINEKQQNKVSKVYILLNELNTCIDLKDKELYYIKYRNTMEQLINL